MWQQSTSVDGVHGDKSGAVHLKGSPLTFDSGSLCTRENGQARKEEHGQLVACAHTDIHHTHTYMHTHSLLSIDLLGDCSPIKPLAPTLTSSSTAMYSSWMFMACSKL